MLLQSCFKDCGCELSLLNQEAGQVPQGNASVLHTQSIDWLQNFEPKPRERNDSHQMLIPELARKRKNKTPYS